MNKTEKFESYIKELIAWNEKFNLTSITDPEEIRIKHFEDSLSVLQAIDLKNEKVLDIGTGAGFPGIPLKIARPDIKLTLMDSTKKKTEFLKHIIKALDLSDVKVVWGRAGEVLLGHFDVVVARAVAKLPKLVPIALTYLKPGGLLIAQKGPEVEEYSGKIKEIKKIELSNGHKRSLVIIKKI